MHKCSSAVRRVTPMNSFQLSKDVKEKYTPFVPSNSASRALVASNKAVHNDAQRPQQSWRKASFSAKLQDTKRQKTYLRFTHIHRYSEYAFGIGSGAKGIRNHLI